MNACTFSLHKDPVMVMRCRHSQDRASTPSALRKIKPQRAQRITESCYFHLSPPLCHSVSSVVFQKTLFRKYQKVSGFLVTATRDNASVDDRVVTKDLPQDARKITCQVPRSLSGSPSTGCSQQQEAMRCGSAHTRYARQAR